MGLLVTAYALMAAADAYSCPSCATARAVRVSIDDGRFWGTLLQVALPLIVLGAIAAALYRIDLPRTPARRPHVARGRARP